MESLPVTCPVCGEKVPKLDLDHARSHGFRTLRAFKQKHDITYETLAQRSRQKFETLYNIDTARWVVGVRTATGEMRYVTRAYCKDFDSMRPDQRPRTANKFPMNTTVFRRHMSGLSPLAIFARGTHSRWFGFDVDTKDDAPVDTLKLVAALEAEGIPLQQIHVSYSGGKGYHVELFLDNVHIKFEDWEIFGRYVVSEAGLIGKAIEFRPTKSNGHAWKLPLTLHPKTGNFAAYCDRRTLEPLGIVDSHDYLFSIQPMPIDVLRPILSRARHADQEIQRRMEEERARKKAEDKEKGKAVQVRDDRVFQTTEEKKQTARRLLRDGLIVQGTRWNATRTIALYLYHEQGLEIDQIREILIEWTAQQIEKSLALTPLDQCIREIDEILKWVQEDTDGFYATERDIHVTRAEIDWVITVHQRYARDLLWALLLKSKAYAKRDGTFYTSDRQLEKFLPISPTTIRKWRKWLVDHNYIETDIPDDDKERKRRYYTGQATTYRLLFEPPETSEVVDSVVFREEMDCRDLLKQIAARLFDRKTLRRMKLL